METRQPNSRHCFVCGVANPYGLKLKFYQHKPGEVSTNITLPELYQGYPGIVHGGIVAAMLDEVAGRTHMGGDPPRFMYTARMEIRYRNSVPVGQPLHLVGHAGRSKGRTASASSAIYTADGTLLAEAELLLVDVPAELLDNADLQALGWKVYTDDEFVLSTMGR
jgi:acyl-coenzyme A thioesterase PaaI-like protein